MAHYLILAQGGSGLGQLVGLMPHPLYQVLLAVAALFFLLGLLRGVVNARRATMIGMRRRAWLSAGIAAVELMPVVLILTRTIGDVRWLSGGRWLMFGLLVFQGVWLAYVSKRPESSAGELWSIRALFWASLIAFPLYLTR